MEIGNNPLWVPCVSYKSPDNHNVAYLFIISLKKKMCLKLSILPDPQKNKKIVDGKSH